MNTPMRTASLGSLGVMVRPKTRSNSSSNTGLEMPHRVPKSVLSHVGRPALSEVNSSQHSGSRVASGKLQSAELCASSLRRAVSSDVVEQRAVEVHSAIASTCLNKPAPDSTVPVSNDVESPNEKALLHTSVEAMALPLDCSDDSYLLLDDNSVVVVDDASDHSSSLPPALGVEDFGQGLPGLLEVGSNATGPLSSTPEWHELLPEEAVSDLEFTDEEDTGHVSDIEEMHPNDDDEHFFDVPEEFKLDDKHLAVLRDVCGVAWHQKQGAAPITPSTPPEFALPIMPTSGDLLMDKFVDLESFDKPILGQLQFVPLE